MAKSPVAVGLGPLETIVNVGWGALPVYITVYIRGNRVGLSSSSTPAHTAVVTLSAAAIKAKCEIVLNFTHAHHPTDKTMYRLVVIKVPRLVKGTLFNVALGGTNHIRTGTTPTYFCGHYVFDQLRTLVGQLSFGDLVTLYQYHEVVTYTTPAVSEVFNEFTYYSANPNEAVHNTIDDAVLSFYDGGELVRTNLPCDTPPPVGKPEQFPFEMEIVVNAIKDHTVTQPAWPYDPDDTVKTVQQDGRDTALWNINLDSHANPIISGLGDWSIDFEIKRGLFSTKRKEKVTQVFPTTVGLPDLRYSGQGPRLRLNKPLPKHEVGPGPIHIPGGFDWDGTSEFAIPWTDNRTYGPPPGFADPPVLFSGKAPYLVEFDPFPAEGL